MHTFAQKSRKCERFAKCLCGWWSFGVELVFFSFVGASRAINDVAMRFLFLKNLNLHKINVFFYIKSIIPPFWIHTQKHIELQIGLILRVAATVEHLTEARLHFVIRNSTLSWSLFFCHISNKFSWASSVFSKLSIFWNLFNLWWFLAFTRISVAGIRI